MYTTDQQIYSVDENFRKFEKYDFIERKILQDGRSVRKRRNGGKMNNFKNKQRIFLQLKMKTNEMGCSRTLLILPEDFNLRI